VSKLVGYHAAMLSNYMVSSVNRSHRFGDNIDKIHGGEEWEKIYHDEEVMKEAGLTSAVDPTVKTNRKLQWLAEDYCQQVRNKCGAYVHAFAFRKGRSRPDRGTLFYMVFATKSLNVLNQYKMGTQRLMQERQEIVNGDYFQLQHFLVGFSDFYSANHIACELKRVYGELEEANVLLARLLNKRQMPKTFGEWKRLIVEESPFPWHSKIIKLLIKQDVMEVKDAQGKKIEKFGRICKLLNDHKAITVQDPSNSWIVELKELFIQLPAPPSPPAPKASKAKKAVAKKTPAKKRASSSRAKKS